MLFVRWTSERNGRGQPVGPWHMQRNGASATQCGIRADWHPHYRSKADAPPRRRAICRACYRARELWGPRYEGD